jgi:hypothetical protein
MLSSEPEKFPIEAGIVPLVFVLADTGLIQTIWSCEGHLQPNSGTLWKTPQVWFCSDDPVVAQLLSVALFDLREKLHCAGWFLRLVPIARGVTTVYSIEPHTDADGADESMLELLREDVLTIAEELPSLLRIMSGGLLAGRT